MTRYGDTVPVSTVIPCFRCARTIGRALESVFQQSQVPAEIILVDDASNDDTLQVLLQFEREKPEWIKVVSLKENSGAASARNAGWALATQTYIAFLDADDTWHPEKLRIQYEFLKSNPGVSLCGHLCAESGVDALSSINACFRITNISAMELLFKSAFSTPTVMLKREMSCRFPEGMRYAEDAFLWQQIAFSGMSVVRMEVQLAYLYKARYGFGGLSSNMWKMEQGELGNFYEHYKAERIGIILLSIISAFSLIKYIKRMLVLGLIKMFRS